MTYYIVRGSKEAKGQMHEITEMSPSRVKAEWIRASYVEHGYTTSVEEIDDPLDKVSST